jgi:aminoglycoside phosphotransferase (APT) family kinase protein
MAGPIARERGAAGTCEMPAAPRHAVPLPSPVQRGSQTAASVAATPFALMSRFSGGATLATHMKGEQEAFQKEIAT